MKNPVIVNGIIINMAAHRGLSAASALELISEAKRIQPEEPKTGWANQSLEPSETLTENHAAFHAARHRIRGLEKAIANCAAGRPHGLKRKKWRSNPMDARTIMDVLGHVLSRPDPKTPGEMLEDASLLLRRTGEWGRLKINALPPMADPDAAPLIIKVKNNQVRLENTATQDYGIRIDAYHAMPATCKIQIKLKTTLPTSIRASLEARIAHALNGRGLGAHGYDSSRIKDIEAHQFIDWQGLRGPMRAWLVGIEDNQNGMEDYQLNLNIEVENAIMEGQ